MGDEITTDIFNDEGFELISLRATGMSCILEKLNFNYEQQVFPFLRC